RSPSETTSSEPPSTASAFDDAIVMLPPSPAKVNPPRASALICPLPPPTTRLEALLLVVLINTVPPLPVPPPRPLKFNLEVLVISSLLAFMVIDPPSESPPWALATRPDPANTTGPLGCVVVNEILPPLPPLADGLTKISGEASKPIPPSPALEIVTEPPLPITLPALAEMNPLTPAPVWLLNTLNRASEPVVRFIVPPLPTPMPSATRLPLTEILP